MSSHDQNADQFEKKKAYRENCCVLYRTACPCAVLGTEEVPQHEVDKWGTEGFTTKSTLPDKLRGIFFMNGNQPENTVTFEHSSYDPTTRKLTLYVPGKRNWSTQHNDTLQTVNCLKLYYVFTFNEDFSHAEIIPWCWNFPLLPCCVHFVMTEDQEKSTPEALVFDRNSSICFGKFSETSYVVERIVAPDGDGGWKRTSHYDGFMKKTKTKCYRVPLDAGSSSTLSPTMDRE